MPSQEVMKFLIDGLSSICVKDVLRFIHQLLLNLQRDRAVHCDPSNDIMGGLDGIVVANHLGAHVEDWSENLTGEFFLETFSDITLGLAPHVCDDDDGLQCRFTTELTEHPEVLSGDSGGPSVGDALDVDDAGKLGPPLISVRKLNPEGWEQKAMWTYVVFKKAAIIFKTSVSLFNVSSKPGVSMRITLCPSRVNSSASWMSVVQDFRLFPTRRFEPLARLTNWRQPGEFSVITIGNPPRLQMFSHFQSPQ